MRKKGNLVFCLVIFILFGLGAYSTIDAAPFAYIPNSGSNTVTVIDTVTTPPSVVATVPVGTNPRGVASVVKTSETFTYVTNFGSDNVSVIRTFQRHVNRQGCFREGSRHQGGQESLRDSGRSGGNICLCHKLLRRHGLEDRPRYQYRRGDDPRRFQSDRHRRKPRRIQGLCGQ